MLVNSHNRTLNDELDYMYSLERFGIKPGLTRIKRLLSHFNSPQNSFPSIHITGTNGKGSTAAMLESVLRAAGLKTGLYTSPHLYNFSERIKISGQPIATANLVRYIKQVKQTLTTDYLLRTTTFFEFTTAIAFKYFADQQVDLAIIEVGMGGRLDATNVIHPLLSIITNIDHDHTNILGSTRMAIAKEKAGIIKQGAPLLTAEKDKRILSSLQKTCRSKKSALIRLNRKLQITPVRSDWHKQSFTVQGIINGNFTIPLLGHHQLDNAGLVLLAVNKLSRHYKIPMSAIKTGLAATRWEGRLEVISSRPFILVDGAHNPKSVEALANFLTQIPRRDVLIIGLKKDKDAAYIIRLLAPLFSHIIVTEGEYQPMPADKLARLFIRAGKEVTVIKDVRQATKTGLKKINKTGGLVITGSLYMIPAALKYLKRNFQ